MQFINFNIKNIITFLVFFAIFFVGINIYQDYGATLDDEIYRKNGELYYDYVKKFFFNSDTPLLDTSGVYTVPVIFEYVLTVITSSLNITDSQIIFEVSHFLNFSIFFISMFFFYKLIKKRFNSYKYGLLGVLFLVFSPRIFSESFYNSRDIFFLSLFILNMYSALNLILKPNFNTSLFFSITSALVIDAKVIGIISPIIIFFFFFLKSLDKNNFFKSNIRFFIYVVLFTIFFVVLFWPFLWNSPANNIYIAFKDIITRNNANVMLDLYLGKHISSDQVQWHYRPLWFLITTPIFISLFFIIGIYYLFVRLSKRFLNLDTKSNTDIWKGNYEMFDVYTFLIIFLTLIITIKFNTTQFNGWRHLYFLYPSIIVIGLYGIYCLNLFFKINYIKKIIYTLTIINIIYLLNWSIINHPFQNVYFNFIAKKYVKNNFDLDYWGLSNKFALKYIIKENKDYPVKVGTISFSDLSVSLLTLNKRDRDKISIVYDLNEADFLITNYMTRFRNNFIIDETRYKKYYSFVVDEISINTIYKKLK